MEVIWQRLTTLFIQCLHKEAGLAYMEDVGSTTSDVRERVGGDGVGRWLMGICLLGHVFNQCRCGRCDRWGEGRGDGS